MPVPWASERARISAVEYRAITVQQLRDLALFIQCLCKTGALRRKGEKVTWANINMYDIRDLIIKPVITHVEQQRGTNDRYSWVEFVAQGEQKPDLMISHSWCGRFRDFMAVVNSAVRIDGLGASGTVWVCTFANSQFGEYFGVGLQDSPFYKAVGAAGGGTLLLVDRETSSLTRIWCGLELHLTMIKKKPLRIFTSAGQLGVSLRSGRLVEAVERWDITRMEASEDTDRRQILNYLGGGATHERQGLAQDADGNILVHDGWRKELSDREVTPDPKAPMRQNGLQEFAHEAGLFKTYAAKFDKINHEVRKQVLLAADESGHTSERTPTKIPRLSDRGVTLAEFRTFTKNMARHWLARGGDKEWDLATVCDTSQYCKNVCPCDMSYVEVLGAGVRKPHIIIDDTWGGLLKDVVLAVDWLAEACHLLEQTVLFFRPLCVNPEDSASQWDSEMQTMVMNSDGLLSVLPPKEVDIVRSSRLLLLQICFQNNRNVYLGCPNGVLACTRPFPDHTWALGNFDSSLSRIIRGARWEQASSEDPEFQARISEQVGSAPGGFHAFSSRLARVVAGPLLREVAMQGDGGESCATIASICRGQGFLMNSAFLRGDLGETPLHVAAAVGNLDAMDALLNHKADPNAEDQIRETPLHYAAFCGHGDAVKLLLSKGAEATAESAFAETALMVAEQSAAGFLDVCTEEVVSLLSTWTGIAGRRHPGSKNGPVTLGDALAAVAV